MAVEVAGTTVNTSFPSGVSDSESPSVYWLGDAWEMLKIVAAMPPLMEGDLVFQESRSAQADAVKAATGSPITHMGIVTLVGGQPHVYEANGPVGRTSLQSWKRRGVGQRLGRGSHAH